MFGILDWKSIGIASLIAFLAGSAAGGWGAYQIDQARVLTAERAADKRVEIAKAETGQLKLAYELRDKQAAQAVLDKQSADRRMVAMIDAAAAEDERRRAAQLLDTLKGNHDVKDSFIAAGHPVHYLPVGWVLQYDSGFAAAGGAARGDPGTPQAAAAGAGAAASDISEWDVLDNHAINAARWADCRRQVNDLLDILDKTD